MSHGKKWKYNPKSMLAKTGMQDSANYGDRDYGRRPRARFDRGLVLHQIKTPVVQDDFDDEHYDTLEGMGIPHPEDEIPLSPYEVDHYEIGLSHPLDELEYREGEPLENEPRLMPKQADDDAVRYRRPSRSFVVKRSRTSRYRAA